MDSRTLKIKRLQMRLDSSRNFIRNIVDLAAECADEHKTIKNSYLVKQGCRQLEFSKED